MARSGPARRHEVPQTSASRSSRMARRVIGLALGLAGSAIIVGAVLRWAYRQPRVTYYGGKVPTKSAYDMRQVPVYRLGHLYEDLDSNVWRRDHNGWELEYGVSEVGAQPHEPLLPWKAMQ